MLTSTQHHFLRCLIRSGPASRTALAGLTGLSKAATSALSRELIEIGLIGETTLVYGQGRPSVLLAIRPDAACLGGVSLREDGTILLLADLDGKVLCERRSASPGTPETTAKAIANGLAALARKVSIPLQAIGIAVPGYVDLGGQRCIRSTRLGWHDAPLADLVRGRLDLPVLLENDANALVRGLQMFGPLREESSFSLVSVEEGIGCGHMLDGRILRGRGGGAGEIAHAPAQVDGLPCRCGKRGCLDTIASLHAIADAARQAGLPGDPDGLQRLAASGQPRAIAILHAAGSALGVAAAQLIQALDPGRLLVGAPSALSDGVYGAAFRQTVSASVLPGFAGGATRSDQAGSDQAGGNKAGGDHAGIGFVAVAPTAWAQGAAGVAAHRLLCGPDTF